MSIDLGSLLPQPPVVLVADDDPNIRDLLRAYLAASGCEVRTARDGNEAWEAVRTGEVDLAVLDLQMPGLSGVDVCRNIKGDPATCWIPVMIVTAHDADSERLAAIDAGADEFLGKPFNALVLLTRARSLLRLRQLHRELEERNALLRRVLHRYVAEDVAETILTDPDRRLRPGGESRRVTVLFADLRGFTRFTETHSAAQAVDLLNRVLPELAACVFEHRGTFDKYIGDAVMAFYGAPESAADDAQRAFRTAVAMQDRFAARMLAEGDAAAGLSLAIGLHSGDAVVGNIGSDMVMDYTVVGDTVNIAQRLQQAAGPGEIWMSEECHQAAGTPDADALGERGLFGRRDPVRVHRWPPRAVG